MQPDIVALGEPMLELNAVEEGPLSQIGGFSVGWGGDTSNFAIAASRLGGRSGYITRLGDDEFAESFMKLWNREGVDCSRVVKDPQAFTGIYFISRSHGRHHFSYYRKGSAASRMAPDFLPADYIRNARILHVSGISQGIGENACDTVFAAMRLAAEAGVRISYDPNYRVKLWPLERARAVIHESIRHAHLVFPSYEDACTLTGGDDPQEIIDSYLGLGPELVVLKMGAEGAMVGAAGTGATIKVPPFRVSSVDMAGAGDTFDAAFVVGYLSGWSPEKCALFANAAGALTTTGLGAVTPIPKRADAESLMENGKKD